MDRTAVFETVSRGFESYQALQFIGVFIKTKFCEICSKNLPLTSFYTNGWYKKRRKYKPNCKRCQQRKLHVLKNEMILSFFKAFKCMRCGFEGEPAQFDCHHRDPEKKSFKIAKNFKFAYSSKKRMLKELAKCDLLCANCHRLIHVL